MRWLARWSASLLPEVKKLVFAFLAGVAPQPDNATSASIRQHAANDSAALPAWTLPGARRSRRFNVPTEASLETIPTFRSQVSLKRAEARAPANHSAALRIALNLTG